MTARTQVVAPWSNQGGGTSRTTYTDSAGQNIPAGSVVLRFMRWEGGDTTLSYADDTPGGSPAYDTYVFGGAPSIGIAYCWNHPGGTNVRGTMTLGAARNYINHAGVAYDGSDASDPFDVAPAGVTGQNASIGYTAIADGQAWLVQSEEALINPAPVAPATELAVGWVDGGVVTRTHSAGANTIATTSNGSFLARAMALVLKDPDAGADETAPVIDTPTATPTSSTVTNGGFNTTEAGPAYCLVTTGSPETVAATIIASGVTVAASASAAAFTGISANEGDYLNFVQEDLATPTPNVSNVISVQVPAYVPPPAPPTLISSSSGKTNTSATTSTLGNNLTYPASIALGNKLILIIGRSAAPSNVSSGMPAGWTQIDTAWANSTTNNLLAYEKIADAGDVSASGGAFPTLTFSSSRFGYFALLNIADADEATSVFAGTAATGTSVNPKSPAATAGWSATLGMLAISLYSKDDSRSTPTSGPAGYSVVIHQAGGPTTAGATGLAFGVATLGLTETNTEDPGQWTTVRSDTWVAQTLLVQGIAPPDTVAPTMNGAISVTGKTATGYTLTWPAASDNVGVTGYKVSLNGGSSYTDVGAVLTYDATGRTTGATDVVRVLAYDAAANEATPLAINVLVAAPTTISVNFLRFSWYNTQRLRMLTGVSLTEFTWIWYERQRSGSAMNTYMGGMVASRADNTFAGGFDCIMAVTQEHTTGGFNATTGQRSPDAVASSTGLFFHELAGLASGSGGVDRYASHSSLVLGGETQASYPAVFDVWVKRVCRGTTSGGITTIEDYAEWDGKKVIRQSWNSAVGVTGASIALSLGTVPWATEYYNADVRHLRIANAYWSDATIDGAFVSYNDTDSFPSLQFSNVSPTLEDLGGGVTGIPDLKGSSPNNFVQNGGTLPSELFEDVDIETPTPRRRILLIS